VTFPRYPRYKGCGLDWLDEAPEHWEVKRLRFVAALNPSKSETEQLDRGTTVSFLPMELIGENGNIELEREKTIAEVESGYTYFRDGDVVLAKITPCFENRKGAFIAGLTNGIGFGTTELIVARPRAAQVDGRYLHLLFQSHAFRSLGEARMYGAGGQKRVPEAFVRDFATGIPPITDQLAIVRFINREIAKIDTLIAEQQRLVELLKEKRQSVITHAVTRGLNPDAPMKPSGVEWLGDVPAHWAVTRLKQAATLIVDCPHETPVYNDEGLYRVIRTADVDRGRIAPTSMRRVSQSEYLKRIRRASLDRNDIAYGREGERWGHAALVPESDLYCLGQRMMQIRASDDVSARFLMWVLNSDATYRQGEVDTVGATSPHVNVETIRSFALVLPSMEEQESIAAFLAEQVQRLDDTVAVAERAIALLQERRTALISAAVTGKIDVRNLVEAA
jgi:type I restriction enzyme S subunit